MWRRECEAYRERLERLGEAFCAHWVVAMERPIRDGSCAF
jgi:hypothetical protein